MERDDAAIHYWLHHTWRRVKKNAARRQAWLIFLPYDNASCERFIKTLNREEIYANDYRDLDHLRLNVEVFIEEYYNRQRLHSALGYQPPEEFEQTMAATPASLGATVRVFPPEERARRHGGRINRPV